ncbi:hypothetical protein JOC78_000869 [Bacillus ectoiniformans]|uniref:DUF6123 family protein n=1 Tax=Bacillus ectoiniformans TaxID=1494429 RepID=UPI0030842A02|nr:hypothetical protein [Bacillus ectoiniformans]
MEKDKSIGDFLMTLEGKGFKFTDDMIAFIYFGKKFTDATDEMVSAAVEITLKVQKHFDSSFFLSILERLKEQKISERHEAIYYAKTQGLL